MAKEDTYPTLPSLDNTSVETLVALLAKVRVKRDYVASVDTKIGKLEAHITAELKARMLAQQMKTVNIVDTGSVTLVNTGRMKTADVPKFLAWWITNKLQPLLDSGGDVTQAMAWFSKNADAEMIRLELEETGLLPDGVDQTVVTTLRFTPAKSTKEGA